MRKFLPLILCWICFATFGQSFRVMTYNIRFDNPADGVNQWGSRKQKVFDLIRKYDPDISGVQEALVHQLKDITGNARGYTYVGVGRDDGMEKGEFSAIVYKKDKFDVLDQGTFWLSEEPEVPGSKSWDAAITRVATWARFNDKATGRKFFVINTHFDHIGKDARARSAEILKQKISELATEIPSIVTGDLNCTREEEPYQILTNGELVELIDPASDPQGTFCSFEVNSIECRPIDYIMITNDWRADQYQVISDHDGKYYPSDHLPVMITLSYMD
ncbi:MAG TPA: endonuclease/exonuclease/phosphatase family protein [Chryseosolibacter sp.]|nr:endonuclease/exonuclease/phosphatase family protein [Chryseosolibacter sp.]